MASVSARSRRRAQEEATGENEPARAVRPRKGEGCNICLMPWTSENPLKHRYDKGFLTLEPLKTGGQECAPCIYSLPWQGVKADDTQQKKQHIASIEQDQTGAKLEEHRRWKDKWVEAKNERVQKGGERARVKAEDMGMGRQVKVESEQALQAEGTIGWVWPPERYKEKFGHMPDYRKHPKRTATFGGRHVVGPMLGPEWEDTEKHLAILIKGVGKVAVVDTNIVGSSQTLDDESLDKLALAAVNERLQAGESAPPEAEMNPDVNPICFASLGGAILSDAVLSGAAEATPSPGLPAHATVTPAASGPSAFSHPLAPSLAGGPCSAPLASKAKIEPAPETLEVKKEVKKEKAEKITKGTKRKAEEDTEERVKKLKSEDVQALLQKVETYVNDLSSKKELFATNPAMSSKDIETTTKNLSDYIGFKNYRSFHAPDLQGRFNGDELYTKGTRLVKIGKLMARLLKTYTASKKLKGLVKDKPMKEEVAGDGTDAKSRKAPVEEDGSAKSFSGLLLQAHEEGLIVNGEILKAAVRRSVLECMSMGGKKVMIPDLLNVPLQTDGNTRQKILEWATGVMKAGFVPVAFAENQQTLQKDVVMETAKIYLLEGNYQKKTGVDVKAEKISTCRAISAAMNKTERIEDGETRKLLGSIAAVLLEDPRSVPRADLEKHIAYFSSPHCPLWREAQSWTILKNPIADLSEMVVQMTNDQSVEADIAEKEAGLAALPTLAEQRPAQLESIADLKAVAEKWHATFTTLLDVERNSTKGFKEEKKQSLGAMHSALEKVRLALQLRAAYSFDDQLRVVLDSLTESQNQDKRTAALASINEGPVREDELGLDLVSKAPQRQTFSKVVETRRVALQHCRILMALEGSAGGADELMKKEVQTACSFLKCLASGCDGVPVSSLSPEGSRTAEYARAIGSAISPVLIKKLEVAWMQRIARGLLCGVVRQLSKDDGPSESWTPDVMPALGDEVSKLEEFATLCCHIYKSVIVWSRGLEGSTDVHLSMKSLGVTGGGAARVIELSVLCTCPRIGHALAQAKLCEDFKYNKVLGSERLDKPTAHLEAFDNAVTQFGILEKLGMPMAKLKIYQRHFSARCQRCQTANWECTRQIFAEVCVNLGSQIPEAFFAKLDNLEVDTTKEDIQEIIKKEDRDWFQDLLRGPEVASFFKDFNAWKLQLHRLKARYKALKIKAEEPEDSEADADPTALQKREPTSIPPGIVSNEVQSIVVRAKQCMGSLGFFSAVLNPLESEEAQNKAVEKMWDLFSSFAVPAPESIKKILYGDSEA